MLILSVMYLTEAMGEDSCHFWKLLQLKYHSFRIFNHEVQNNSGNPVSCPNSGSGIRYTFSPLQINSFGKI